MLGIIHAKFHDSFYHRASKKESDPKVPAQAVIPFMTLMNVKTKPHLQLIVQLQLKKMEEMQTLQLLTH
jgi:hypothetical protein